MEIDLTKSVTQDFVDSFKDEPDFSGPFFWLCLNAELPLGVDPDDSRVRDILDRARKQRQESGEDSPA